MGSEYEVSENSTKYISHANIYSTTKNRKLGWHGFVDSNEGIFDSIKEMADMKMVPKPTKTADFDIKYHGY
jgi:hypothetical protein